MAPGSRVIVRMPQTHEQGELLGLTVFVVTEPGKPPVAYDTARLTFAGRSSKRHTGYRLAQASQARDRAGQVLRCLRSAVMSDAPMAWKAASRSPVGSGMMLQGPSGKVIVRIPEPRGNDSRWPAQRIHPPKGMFSLLDAATPRPASATAARLATSRIVAPPTAPEVGGQAVGGGPRPTRSASCAPTCHTKSREGLLPQVPAIRRFSQFLRLNSRSGLHLRTLCVVRSPWELQHSEVPYA